MATQDFALNPAGTERITVHWTMPDRPITVLLNGSILGVLATADERMLGKNFSLPDQSPLHVRFQGDQPYVFRYQYQLMPMQTPVVTTSAPVSAPGQKNRWPRYLLFWLIVNLVVVIAYILINALELLDAMGNLNVTMLFFSALLLLVDFIGLAGLGLLLAWKKIGFYLLSGYVGMVFLLNVLTSLLTQHFSIRSFFPLAAVILLYFRLRRLDVRDQFS